MELIAVSNIPLDRIPNGDPKLLRQCSADKETDRHWEQGEDPSLVDFKVKEFRRGRKKVVADISARKKWRKLGVRYCQRKSSLSINTVRDILDGMPVKVGTLAGFVHVMNG